MTRGRFWRSAGAIWWRNFLSWRKFWRSSILLNFGEPLTNLLALGMGLGAYVTMGVPFLQFIAPGLLAVTSMNAVTFDSGFEGYDRLNANGVYQSMMTSPLTVPEIVAGEYLWEATRSLLYGAVFFIVVLAFGLVHSAWAALLPVPLMLFGVVFAAPALYVAARAKTHEQLFYYFSLVITPMFMFSGVFFPVNHLPWYIVDIIYALPLYHGVSLARELMTGQISIVCLWNFLWILGYAAVLAYLPVKALERRLTA